MDVVLTPTGSAGKAWDLKDRLGRSLGKITRPKDTDDFQIQPDEAGLLVTVKRAHASLDAAMSAIASVANGACTLDSQDWG
ncbi:hypothetical protein FV232_03320 [Methylobacterium sp. WL30]|uniref:hypothetical protein n=1 Tax=unclassified Methylobacterium TaxID=2615210 RepID=UPI0010DB4F6C|nr:MULTISPECIES: hypothetical protein [unclassified Methylobacterium]RYF11216.1 MAG: hypothetical protein EOO77_19880 [Oxalobacteraceae bacterium]MCJ2037385.1 hypothetical protein [Methylobacterium sp. J-059]TXM93318.1 hypothetical protein FV223_08725 [Methylobacterium sp. WL116]TXN40302.1 hypothetical protein FV225_06825 [Methylobacterium sp. WL93]TXN51336.1 hypothetical protein FV227_07875 [Methylobacterium sp. WL119]